jgi:hypothetical protein
MKLDLSVSKCSCHAPGAVYQFAEGLWPEEIKGGIFMHEAAFDFVEPSIKVAWPHWSGIRRYGVTEITSQSAVDLALVLEHAAVHTLRMSEPPEWLGSSGLCKPLIMRGEFERNPHRYNEVADLFHCIAVWLRDASARPSKHCLLGI